MPNFCRDCRQPCKVIPLDNSFDYAGTHCTGGRPGTHYPAGYGDPVSDCCEAEVEDEYGILIEEVEVDDPRY